MVVHRAGDEGHDHTLSRYVGPTEIRKISGRTYLVDAGSGETIAELTHAAAEAARTHHSVTVTVHDGTTVTVPEGTT